MRRFPNTFHCYMYCFYKSKYIKGYKVIVIIMINVVVLCKGNLIVIVSGVTLVKIPVIIIVFVMFVIIFCIYCFTFTISQPYLSIFSDLLTDNLFKKMTSRSN